MERHLVVIGFPKCATTSLFHLLQQIPGMAATSTKETRLLYPAIREGRSPTAEELDALAAAFPADAGRVGLEASPATVFGGPEVAGPVAGRLADLHVVVVVRDPADRFWSAFQYLKAKTVLSQDHAFDDFIERNLDGLRRGVSYGPNPNVDFQLEAGRYARYLPAWVDATEGRVALVTAGSLAADPLAVLDDLARWVGLDGTPGRLDVTRQNVTRRPRHPRLHRLAWRVNDRGEQFFRRHPRVEDRLRSLYYLVNGQPRSGGMSAVRRAQLDELYAPDLRALAALVDSGRLQGPLVGLDRLLATA